jgi:hypothetical protein
LGSSHPPFASAVKAPTMKAIPSVNVSLQASVSISVNRA